MFHFFLRNDEPTPDPCDRMEHLAAKIAELAKQDIELKTFGAANFGSGHGYQMNQLLTYRELADFENDNNVKLPQDYADFLTKIGNGGIGPYYGLFSLAQSVTDETGVKTRGFLSSPFPLSDAFNSFDDENLSDDDLYDDKYICGSIVLSHQGCGYYDRLVITGPQAGQVWFDGRASDQGLSPLNGLVEQFPHVSRKSRLEWNQLVCLRRWR